MPRNCEQFHRRHNVGGILSGFVGGAFLSSAFISATIIEGFIYIVVVVLIVLELTIGLVMGVAPTLGGWGGVGFGIIALILGMVVLVVLGVLTQRIRPTLSFTATFSLTVLIVLALGFAVSWGVNMANQRWPIGNLDPFVTTGVIVAVFTRFPLWPVEAAWALLTFWGPLGRRRSPMQTPWWVPYAALILTHS